MSNRDKDPWGQFLDKIKGKVDDALVVYKGEYLRNFGIYAQINKDGDKYQTKMKPTKPEVESWIKAFNDIDYHTHPSSSTLKCTFVDGNEVAPQTQEEAQMNDKNPYQCIFHIIEYGANFIRAHLIQNGNQEKDVKSKNEKLEIIHKSLFFSQSKSYIFVGYCSSNRKINTPSQTFCAIESLARFVRDCELYNKMEPINLINS